MKVKSGLHSSHTHFPIYSNPSCGTGFVVDEPCPPNMWWIANAYYPMTGAKDWATTMKPNSKKLLTALLFLMTPWLMACTLIFLMPAQTGWLATLQTITIMMACGTSAMGGMCALAFINREVQDMAKWERLGAMEATK